MAGASVFGQLLVIQPGTGWFWTITDDFMIYTIYMVYFLLLYWYHFEGFSSR